MNLVIMTVESCVGRKLAKACRDHRLIAVVCVQRAVKRFLCRTQFSRTMAIVKIQSVARQLLSKNEHWYHRTRSNAAIFVQAFCRKCKAKNVCRNYHVIDLAKKANIHRYGMYPQRSNSDPVACLYAFSQHFLKAARVSTFAIQSKWRARIARRMFTISVCNLVLCQATCRSWLASQEFQRRLISAEMLQCFGRQWLARTIHKQLKKIKSQRNDAAIVLQRSWRRFSTYVRFRSVILDIILIQSAFRRLQAQRYQKDRHDAIFRKQNAALVSRCPLLVNTSLKCCQQSLKEVSIIDFVCCCL
jgi:hypothetical protein